MSDKAKCLICAREFTANVKPFKYEKRICVDCYMKADVPAIDRALEFSNTAQHTDKEEQKCKLC